MAKILSTACEFPEMFLIFMRFTPFTRMTEVAADITKSKSMQI